MCDSTREIDCAFLPSDSCYMTQHCCPVTLCSACIEMLHGNKRQAFCTVHSVLARNSFIRHLTELYVSIMHNNNSNKSYQRFKACSYCAIDIASHKGDSADDIKKKNVVLSLCLDAQCDLFSIHSLILLFSYSNVCG